MYVRHRDRMIRESVFTDLQDTLIACRWLAGTTSRPLIPITVPPTPPLPPIPPPAPTVITTTPGQVLELLEGHRIILVDAFPESDPAPDSTGSTELNTFAMDTGRPGEEAPVELGNPTLYEKPYTFNLAFWAVSDGAATAVFNDLFDRYKGNIVDGDSIPLYNYLADPPTTVVRMDVESFRYTRDADTVTPSDVHLYFGELVIVDWIEP
jgi:hypothetical protein